MHIDIVDKTDSILYSFDILPPVGLQIISTLPASNSTYPYLFIEPATGYRIVRASATDTSIPGGTYITTLDARPVIALDTYGQIYSLDPDIVFVPEEKNGHISLRARKNGTPIATLSYTVDFFITKK